MRNRIDEPQREIERDAAEQIGVEAVEHAAVTADQAAGVFDSGIALERALNQIAGLRGDRRDAADHGALPPRQVEPGREHDRDPGEDRDPEAAGRTLDRLAR